MIGEIVSLFAFDVANEIVSTRVGRVLGKAPEPLDIRRDHTSPRDVPFHRPLSVEPEAAFSIDGRPVRVQVRIYDVGVISVILRVAVEKDTLDEMTPYHRAVFSDGRDPNAAAQEICRQVVSDLGNAILKPSLPTEPEAYTVFCLSDLGGPQDVSEWLHTNSKAVAGLLSDMAPNRLADLQIAEVLRYKQSFERSDLVVVDWDAALVVDLEGYLDDVLYVLELANLQLEEFKVMDAALDRHLNTAYSLLERRPGFAMTRPNAQLRLLRELSVDFAKLADEVTHITKFLGDWYLARVYMSARERFHLEQWHSSVEHRLKQLNDLFSVVRAEVNERRMLWLEVIVVVFFAIDLLAIVFGKK